MDVFQADIAGQTLRYKFIYPLTRLFFRGGLEPAEEDGPFVSVTPEDIERCRGKFPEGALNGQIEFKALISRTSCALLSEGPACVFHAAAVSAEGRAWLLTAPSGTGKSTQVMNWLKNGDHSPEVICGDMPALRLEEDGTVTVCPSPWNGKENLRGAGAAKLGGIICLEKADENTIRPLSPVGRIGRCITQFVCSPEDGVQADNLARLADAMLSNYPVWLMRNRGDMQSTELMLKTLFEGVGGSGTDCAEPEKTAGAKDAGRKEKTPDCRAMRAIDCVHLESVCGMSVLLADKSAAGMCPYVSIVNDTGAQLWKFLSEPHTAEQCAEMLKDLYPSEDEAALREGAEDFVSLMSEKGYLVPAGGDGGEA